MLPSSSSACMKFYAMIFFFLIYLIGIEIILVIFFFVLTSIYSNRIIKHSKITLV